MTHLLYILWFITLPSMYSQAGKKIYWREYYQNGNPKAEGWKIDTIKVDYWYLYYENGKVACKGKFENNQKKGYWYFYTDKGNPLKEGHFINNKAEKWWIIYDIAQENQPKIVGKYQYQMNKKNGFCLLYKNDKLFKAEKYINDHKTGE